MARNALIALSVGLLAATGACTTDGAKAPRAGGPEGAATKKGADPTVPATEGYELSVEVPEPAKAGQDAIARVQVEPHGGWHMNTDFPSRLQVTAPDGVQVATLEQVRNDAERLDDDALVFSVLFTPDAKARGPKTIEGKISFAVCGNMECAPQEATVALTFDVACDPDVVAC